MRGPLLSKIGSTSLVSEDGAIKYAVLYPMAAQMAESAERGYGNVVVTSGATLLGRGKAPWLRESIKDDVMRGRIAAGIGQPELACAWQRALGMFGIAAVQILTTHAEIASGARTEFIELLLARGIVPIINEDDTRSKEEMTAYLNEKGDNDKLAYHVAVVIRAERVFFLTDVDGVCDMNDAGECISDPIKIVPEVTDRIRAMVRDRADGRPTGMGSKVDAADRLQKAGIIVYIARAGRWVIIPALEGKHVGTMFPAH